MTQSKAPGITEAITLLREKAAEFNETADRLETMLPYFSPATHRVTLTAPSPFFTGNTRTPTVTDIVGVLRKKGAARAQEIAAKLQTSKEQVLSVVNANPDEFDIRSRGWITLPGYSQPVGTNGHVSH